MYARSALTMMGSGAGGWSATSGGASNGLEPGSLDDVIFDSNSGTARVVSGSLSCRDCTIQSGCAAITMADVQLYRNLTASSAMIFTFLAIRSAVVHTLNTGPLVINNLSCADNGSITLAGHLTVAGPISNSTGNSAFLSANFDVTADRFSWGGGAGSTLNMGSGTWTLTGGSSGFNTSGITITSSSATIKFTSSTAQQILQPAASASFLKVWNANTYVNADPLLSGLLLQPAMTIATLQLEPGSTTLVNGTQTVGAVSGSGETATITLRSAYTVAQTTITKSGGGSVYLNRYAVKNLIGSPGSTWNVLNGTNQGNNTNFVFVPPNYNFFAFF